ncbi:hypothetical protein SAMN05421823_11571 [Catalinimonas alkaloidigena]|uniref:Uncharacterized protein n=1 Tax=Catalinimonas alkaloidigena TaxID=1075417 RepID=A0A1G9U357_9BACT|nr:hypothetical protein [Catalinimonas alkaloidigena]SDM54332.1 hypothetical protein SAMN05421823_11571 [Catalinimonas alkaloidigena]
MRPIISFGMWGLIGQLTLTSVEAQTVVIDQAKRRQLESMVFMRWSKSYFRPKWYYRLMHNQYRTGEDRRTILQLTPTLAFTEINRLKSEDEEQSVEVMQEQRVREALDRSANLTYQLVYRKSLAQQLATLQQLVQDCAVLGLDPSSLQRVRDEVERHRDRIDQIRQAYVEEGRKMEQWMQLENDLFTLTNRLIKLRRLCQLRQRFTNP